MTIDIGIWPKPFLKPGYDQRVKPYHYYLPVICNNFSPKDVNVTMTLEGRKPDNTWETIQTQTVTVSGVAWSTLVFDFQKPADQWDYSELRVTATREDTGESDTDNVVVHDLINYYENADNIKKIMNYLYEVKIYDGSSWATPDPPFIVVSGWDNPYWDSTVTINYTFNPNQNYVIRIIPKQSKILEWIDWQNTQGVGNYAYLPMEIYWYLECMATPSQAGAISYGVRAKKQQTAGVPPIGGTEGMYATAKSTSINDKIIEVTVLSGPYSNYDKDQDPHNAEDGDVMIYPEINLTMPDVGLNVGIIKLRVDEDLNNYLHDKISDLGTD